MTIKSKFGPWALIIGGSEGIGAGLAKRLASEGLNLVLTARKTGPLEQTAAAVMAEFDVEVRTQSLDMTAPDMMEGITAATKDIDIGLVIYNAGAMDRMTTFVGDTVEGHLHTIRLNCEGPTRIAHHFAVEMKAKGRGGIVLMGAGAGLAGTYGVPVYAATKAYDMILAEGLWYELKEFGVSVLCAVIGGVKTPAHHRLLGVDLPNMWDADEVANEIIDNLENGPTLFTQSVQALLAFAMKPEREAVVSMMGDASKAFAAPTVNTAPFNSNGGASR